MNLETELCKRLADRMKDLLPGVAVFGNWVPDDEVKGLEPYEAERLDIDIAGRRYEGYSSPIVEIVVRLDLSVSLDADVSLDATLGHHERLVGALEEWQHALAAVKRDLSVSAADVAFSPVGLRVDDAGTLSLDRETKKRNLTHQFTLKGRITNS